MKSDRGSENTVHRLFCQRLKRDAKIYTKSDGPSKAITVLKMLSRATFLSSVLHGSKIMSSFELVKCYSPTLPGIPKTDLFDGLIKYHEEQTARRALQKFLHSVVPARLKKFDPRQEGPVYIFKRALYWVLRTKHLFVEQKITLIFIPLTRTTQARP